MQPEFWHERWSSNQIGFHESQVNPMLLANFAALELQPGARIFLPLCGKTVDIDWLLSRGQRVVGAELSPLAVEQLFERLALTPTRTRAGELERLSAAGLDIFLGNILALSGADLGEVDAVYDRAALIALPLDLRRKYAAHLADITGEARELLITLEYEQPRMPGPPFSVSDEEVGELYGARRPELLVSRAMPDGFRGTPTTEKAWLLRGR
jgi:thiopurine S-methyltransferase